MSIAIQCTSCGKSLKVKAELVGRKGKCPDCGSVILLVPRSSGSQAATAAVAVASEEPCALEAEQVRSLFTGQIKRERVGIFRKAWALSVLVVLLLSTATYLVVLAGVAAAMWWLSSSPFGSSLSPAIFWTLEIALGLIFVCLLRPLTLRRRAGGSDEAPPIRQAPAWDAFLAQICEQVGSALPQPVQSPCRPCVTAEYASGWSGLPTRNVTLTLGLPLVACLTVEELACLLTTELARLRKDAGSYRLDLIRRINAWLWHSVYGQNRFEEWLAIVAERPYFHAAKLLLPLGAWAWISRAVLFVPMFVSNTFASGLLRRAESEADLAAVRLAGRSAFARVLERVPMIEFAWQGIVAELDFLHTEQQLPDNLPQQTALRMLETTPEVYAALRGTLHADEEASFDVRISAAERLEAVQAEAEVGVVACSLPARALFLDFDKVARKITFDYYVARFGPQRLKTGMQPVPALSGTNA